MSKQNKCAQCGKDIIFTNENKDLWPFCSKRCKMIDLGKWLGEKYVVVEVDNESSEHAPKPKEEETNDE